MRVPKCLVIVPDGNRRWAQKNHLTDAMGHVSGLLNSRCISRAAFAEGVEHVVLWAASESNLFRRPPGEIEHLFSLLKRELLHRLAHPDNVGFHLCGAWRTYTKDEELVRLVDEAHAKTACYTRRQSTILFGYNGRRELQEAFTALAVRGERATAEAVRACLWTSHLPDVDLLIRTGAQKDPHWSEPLLPWQMCNTQLHFDAKLWPDFTVSDLNQVLEDFAQRPRRKGA